MDYVSQKDTRDKGDTCTEKRPAILVDTTHIREPAADVKWKDIFQKAVDDRPIKKIDQPEPGMFRDFRAISVLDFDQLADDLNQALKGGPQKKTQIYSLLYLLHREQ